MAASHGARELLALLAILPDGLSDVEIIQSQIPAKDILACKSVLLSTSLAYTDDARLKVLVPVREYMQQHYPASQSFIQSVRTLFEDLLSIWRKHHGHQLGATIHKQIASNLANMQSILALELYSNNPRMEDISKPMHGLYYEKLFPAQQPKAEVFMITFLFNMWWLHVIPNVEQLLSKAEKNFDSFDDPVVKYFIVMLGIISPIMTTFREQGNFFTLHSSWQLCPKNIRQECHVVHKIATCELKCQKSARSTKQCTKIPEAGKARDLLHQCGLDGSDTDSMNLANLADTHYIKSEYSEVQEIYMQIKNATSDQKPSIMHSVAVVNLAEIAIIRVMAELHLHKDHNTLAAQALLLQYAQSVDRAVRSYSLERLANLKNWGITAIGWVPQWTTVSLAYAFQALSSMGYILLALGDLNTAQSLFIVALEEFTWMDVHRSRAECMLHLGEISHQKGDFEEAISSFKAARPLFERSFQAKDVKHVDSLVRGLEEEIEQGHNTKVAYLSTLNVPTQDIVQLAAEMEDGSANPV
ncbi:hypothetical protein B0H14DRAFT_2647881 [Mycena olivaceomarginata]|nr:hypothetical protein B0H14DRAFT_2647881 [Mycena olivaceomarginata]